MANFRGKRGIESLMDPNFFKMTPDEKFSKRTALFYSRRVVKSKDDYYLLLFLRFMGINLFSSKHRRSCFGMIMRFLSPVIFHLIYIEGVLSNASYMIKANDAKLFLSNILNLTTILILWYMLLFKKKKIKKYLVSANCIVFNPSKKKKSCLHITNMASILLFIIPFIYALAAVYFNSEDQLLDFYFWRFKEVSNLNYIIAFCTECGLSMMTHSFVGIVSTLYVSCCYKVVKSLSSHREQLNKSLNEGESRILSTTFLQLYLKLLDAIESLEDAFTSSAFILTVSNGFSLFTLMAISFMSKSIDLSDYVILQMFMLSVTSGIYLVVTIVAASQIPLEIERNVKYFTKLNEKSVLESPLFSFDDHQLVLIKGAVERRVIVLSGCHLIYFTRHMLISMIGALITYGLLVMQMNNGGAVVPNLSSTLPSNASLESTTSA